MSRVQQIVATHQAEAHKEDTPTLWARQKSSSLPTCQPICLFAFTMFFLSSFLVLCSSEYMRKESRDWRKVRLEEGKKERR